MSEDEKLKTYVDREIDRHRPNTQRECCEVAARACVAFHGRSFYEGLNLAEIADASARGLFGAAYEKADRTQKSIWSDMCEAALRQAIEEVP